MEDVDQLEARIANAIEPVALWLSESKVDNEDQHSVLFVFTLAALMMTVASTIRALSSIAEEP